MYRAPLIALVLLLVGCTARDEARILHIDNITDLTDVIQNDGVGDGDEIILAPGEYQLTRPLWVSAPNLTIRGATGNRDDVVLIGGGMNQKSGAKEIFNLRASGITIRDITIRDCFWNGIQVRGQPEIDDISIINVKSIDIGQRHIKASGFGKTPNRQSRNLLIERCHMVQTKERKNDEENDNNNYIGGMDLMMEEDLIVRDCVFENIRGADGGGRGAIFIWQGCINPTIERNVFINCDRGICLGNPHNVSQTLPTEGFHVRGGVVRNNTILRGEYIALELSSVKDVLIAHNTIYSENVDYGRTVIMLQARFGEPVSGVRLVENLIRGQISDRNPEVGSGYQLIGGIHDTEGDTITADWFVDAAAGDLHLSAAATGAIDAAGVVEEVEDDVDGQPRPAEQRDIGADERH